MPNLYQKISVAAKIADNADFNPLKDSTNIADYKPDAAALNYEIRRVSAATGGTTVSLAMYTTVDNIIVKNEDPIGGNRVTATYRTGDGGAVSIVNRALPQDFIKTGGNVTIANNLLLTANSAAVECTVMIIGT